MFVPCIIHLHYACIIPFHNVLFLCTTYVFSIFENDIVPFRARKISMIGSRLAGMYRAYFTIISNVSLTQIQTNQPRVTPPPRPEPFCGDLWNGKGSDRTTPGAQLQPRFIFHSTFCTVSRNQKVGRNQSASVRCSLGSTQAKSVYIPIGCQCFAAETRHSKLHKVQPSSPFFGRSGRSPFAAGSVGRLCRFGRSCP